MVAKSSTISQYHGEGLVCTWNSLQWGEYHNSIRSAWALEDWKSTLKSTTRLKLMRIASQEFYTDLLRHWHNESYTSGQTLIIRHADVIWATSLNQTHTFEWCEVRCGPKNKHHIGTCLKEIGLSSNFIKHFTPSREGGGKCIHLRNQHTCTSEKQ